MSSNSSSSPPPRAPPHIRLNSAQEDLLQSESLLNSRTKLSKQPSSRSLTPGSGGPPPRGPSSAPHLYTGPGAVQDSSEHLLPPSRSRSHRLRDDEPHTTSPPQPQSGFSSRRSSWSSEHSRDSRGYENPFADSRAPSRAGSDEDVNTQTVSEKYTILPSAGLLLFPEDVEKDDYLHNPSPDDNKRDCDIWTRRGFTNLGGLLFLIVGLLVLFIGYPVLTFVRKFEPVDPCKDNPDCLSVGKVDLLKNLRRGLIDPDTPSSAMSKTAHDGSTWNLVFSDEFSTPGRSFFSGDDPYFQAVDIWYGVTEDLEWYDPDAVTTNNGVLELRFDAFQNHGLNYRSGMVQTWNQLCFSGGRLEASISLPGRGDTSGFWPGFWTMGNLGRPGYASTTEGLWPYSYHDSCDAGITANQSSQDGISYLPGMRLPACTCSDADHPTPGKSRSSPEIDVIEASVVALPSGDQIGGVSQSYQAAPMDIWYQPNYDFVEVYDNQITMMNAYKGGPFQQVLSGMSNLNNDWYNGNAYQTYAFEYTPGGGGDITWFVGEDATWHLDAKALAANGNIGQRTIAQEPMSVIMNFGMSSSFAPLNLTGIAPLLPATMRFDYVRIYQDSNSKSVTCDPDGYETTSYITNHPAPYANPNLTSWSDTGYSWPKNSFVDNC